MSKLIISELYNHYLVLHDSVKVVRKAFVTDSVHLFRNTIFSYDTLEGDVSDAIQELEDKQSTALSVSLWKISKKSFASS